VKGINNSSFSGTTAFDGPDNTTYDYDGSASLGFSLIAKMPPKNVTGIVFGKRNSGSNGYLLYASGSNLIFYVFTTGTSATCSIAGPWDGAVHEIRCEINKTTGKATLTVADTGVTSGPKTITGSATIATPFTIGAGYTVGAQYVTYRHLAIFEGSDAEGLAAEATTLTYGDQNTTPVLDTYTRASLACPEVGNESGFGLRVAKYASGAFASGYDADFSHASKLGALIEAAATNLCKGSEEAATGTDYSDIGTPTKTSNALEAPDGTQTMNRIAASGSVEGRYQTIAVTAAKKYTASIHARRGISGTNAFAELEIYDASNGATIDNVQIDLNTNDERVRPSILITTPAGCTSVEMRVKVDDGSDLAEWGWQFELGYLTSYIPTPTGAAATRAAVVAKLSDGVGTYADPTRGEVEAISTFIEKTSIAVARHRFEFFTTSKDRVRAYHWTNGRAYHQIADSTAANKWANFGPNHVGAEASEYTSRTRWDSTAVIEGYTKYADRWINGSRDEQAAPSAGWTASTNYANLHIGQNQGGGGQIDGVLARLRVWDSPRADSP